MRRPRKRMVGSRGSARSGISRATNRSRDQYGRSNDLEVGGEDAGFAISLHDDLGSSQFGMDSLDSEGSNPGSGFGGSGGSPLAATPQAMVTSATARNHRSDASPGSGRHSTLRRPPSHASSVGSDGRGTGLSRFENSAASFRRPGRTVAHTDGAARQDSSRLPPSPASGDEAGSLPRAPPHASAPDLRGTPGAGAGAGAGATHDRHLTAPVNGSFSHGSRQASARLPWGQYSQRASKRGAASFHLSDAPREPQRHPTYSSLARSINGPHHTGASPSNDTLSVNELTFGDDDSVSSASQVADDLVAAGKLLLEEAMAQRHGEPVYTQYANVIEDFRDNHTFMTDSRQIKVAVCVTVFNEEELEVRRTLEGISLNMGSWDLSREEVVVAIVADGRVNLSDSLKVSVRHTICIVFGVAL